MKTKQIISLLAGITFVALSPATWAAGHNGGGGEGFHGGGGGFHSGGGARFGAPITFIRRQGRLQTPFWAQIAGLRLR